MRRRPPAWRLGPRGERWEGHKGPDVLVGSVLLLAQSRPFDLLVFRVWSIFSHDPKRLTFYFQVLWVSEFLVMYNDYNMTFRGYFNLSRLPGGLVCLVAAPTNQNSVC